MEQIQNYEDASFWHKMDNFPEENLFQEKHKCNFDVALGLFYCAKFKKYIVEKIQSYTNISFWGPKWWFAPNEYFFWKSINIIFLYLLASFTTQNVKEFLRWNKSYDNKRFLRQKWCICHKNVFWKTIKITFMYLFVCFILHNFLKIVRMDPELW